MESNLRRAAARMMLLLGMLLLAQEAFSQDESLFTSDWRDPATGDWLMGFRPEGVVYDCRVWDYRTKVPEGDGWALLLESGGETLQVKVGREEDGRRSIAVDGRPATVCEKLPGRVMPDYPTADGRGFTDNGYRVDSVTVCGWYVNRPARLQGKGQTFEGLYQSADLALYKAKKAGTKACTGSYHRMQRPNGLFHKKKHPINFPQSILWHPSG